MTGKVASRYNKVTFTDNRWIWEIDAHFDLKSPYAMMYPDYYLTAYRQLIGKTDDIHTPLCRHSAIISREMALKGVTVCRVCGKPLPIGVGRYNDHFVLQHELCVQPICLDCSENNPDEFHKAFRKGADIFAKLERMKRMSIAITEFCALVDIVTARHGQEVLISTQDENGHMHLTKEGKHLGYIDINTGSLVWDKGEQ